MAIESVVANAGSGGSSFAVDTITGSVQVPYAKLMSGTDTSEELIGGDAANGLDVDVTRIVPGVTATALGKAEDAAHASGDVGVAMLAVRRDTAASGTSADGDYGTVNTDSAGRIWVNGSGATQPVSDASGSLTTDTPQLPAALGQAAAAGSVSVVLASDQGTVPISDGSGSLTTDSPQLPATLGQKAMAASMAVVLASDQASVPVAATLQAGSAAIGKLAANSGVDIGDVDVTSLPNVTLAAGTNTNEVVGDVAHDAVAAGNPLLHGGYASAAAPTDVSADGDAVRAWHLRNGAAAAVLTAAGALIGGDAANGLDVDVTRVSGTVTVGGVAAHDAAISGSPVRLAGRALSADYTAVATGDTADLITDLNGKQIVLPYAIPENMEYGCTAAITGTSLAECLAAAASGIRHYVTQITVTNSHATVGTLVEIRDGTSTVMFRGYAAPVGGGFAVDFPVPLRGTAATAVNAYNITTGSNTYVSVSGYKAP